MPDINFLAATVGDVCNQDGDIRGRDDGQGPHFIRSGVAEVTQKQATLAEMFGWERCGEDGDLVKVKRA